MADLVLVRVIRNLTDMHEGDEAWVEESDAVTGMAAGGYFEIVDRGAPRDAAPVGSRKKTAGGSDQA